MYTNAPHGLERRHLQALYVITITYALYLHGVHDVTIYLHPMPMFFEALNHPLWPHGRAFVYYSDSSLISESTLTAFADNGTVPLEPTDKAIDCEGCLHLTPGDALFVRSQNYFDPYRDECPDAWIVGVPRTAGSICGDRFVRTSDMQFECIEHSSPGLRCFATANHDQSDGSHEHAIIDVMKPMNKSLEG
ncbi:hypothetical protein BD410DRAFT_810330 [Rickenella mellea]|uniref:Uncharacterized protein n=1 Tax=Rickenella mellea TaxID=50990 RepID=A0A4Y7PEG7_9AGAM|nr:hypothetical protein BD410DRAFT_810330 [Rickenella mellea]